MHLEKISVRAPRGIPSKMVSTYVDRCLTALPIALAAMDRSDFAHLRVFGHRLKGSGGAYGIPALTEIGAAIEAAAVRCSTAELRQHIAAVEECLSRIEISSD